MQKRIIQIENVTIFKRRAVGRSILNLRTGEFFPTNRLEFDCDCWKIMMRLQEESPNKDIYREDDKLEIVEEFEVSMTTSRELLDAKRKA